jgi:hypothetical protein
VGAERVRAEALHLRHSKAEDMSTRYLVRSAALGIAVSIGAPAMAHSLKDLEAELSKREPYIEIVRGRCRHSRSRMRTGVR